MDNSITLYRGKIIHCTGNCEFCRQHGIGNVLIGSEWCPDENVHMPVYCSDVGNINPE